MRAIQAEICKAVIKGLAVELHDIGITSLMFSVAMIAFLIDRVGAAPMQALLTLSVRRNLLVAIKTKPYLRPLRKGLMTIFAILLVLCMIFRERSRHDQPVEQALRLGRC